MDRYTLWIGFVLCAVLHLATALGQSEESSNLMTRLDSLEKLVTKQQDQLVIQNRMITDLQGKVKGHEVAIAEQRETIQKQQSTIDEQQKTISKQQNEISRQKSRQSIQNRRLKLLEELLTRKFGPNDNVSGSQDNVSDMTEETTVEQKEPNNGTSYTDADSGEAIQNRGIAHMARGLSRRLVLGSDGPVAFHAVNTHGETSHVGTNPNIVFDTVHLNLGAGYHNQHGLFIAPVAGVYLFSTSILSYKNEHPQIDVSIIKNGAALARAYGYGDSGHHDQGSVTVVTQLAVNDEVWVKDKYDEVDSYWGDSYTSFTGCLLWSM